jgi:hypothetical protein
MKTIVASELRRYCITPTEVNTCKMPNRACSAAPAALLGRGKSPVSRKKCTEVTIALP